MIRKSGRGVQRIKAVNLVPGDICEISGEINMNTQKTKVLDGGVI